MRNPTVLPTDGAAQACLGISAEILTEADLWGGDVVIAPPWTFFLMES